MSGEHETRIILYTGKGGVGKTSVCAATALRCAELGRRTIVLSTDIAHSLADSFDREIEPEPTLLAPNLWAQEVDIYHQMDRYWGTVQGWLSSVLRWRGAEDLLAEETSILPGMDELASLLQIVLLHDSGEYECILVDCAPTGETLRFLSFPEVAQWYLKRIFPIERRAAAALRPVMRRISDVPVPSDEVFLSIRKLILQLDRMHQLLSDRHKSSLRLVLNPEKMVIKEAQRTFTYLQLYGFASDLVVANRIIPPELEEGYLSGWRSIQARYLEQVEGAFSPLPVLTAPLFEEEVVGMPMLRRMAEAIYGERDPSQIFFHGHPYQISREDGRYVLRLRLPFARKEELELSRRGDELHIRAGQHRRNLMLPRAMMGLTVERAQLEDGELRVYWTSSEEGSGRPVR